MEGEVFVIKWLKTNLLGLPAITLSHLCRDCTPMEESSNIKQQFSAVFMGLGSCTRFC